MTGHQWAGALLAAVALGVLVALVTGTTWPRLALGLAACAIAVATVVTTGRRYQ